MYSELASRYDPERLGDHCRLLVGETRHGIQQSAQLVSQVRHAEARDGEDSEVALPLRSRDRKSSFQPKYQGGKKHPGVVASQPNKQLGQDGTRMSKLRVGPCK